MIKNIFKWAIPASFHLFSVFFKKTIQFLLQINVKKCPSSIRWWDSNSQPFEHESPSITTRPGLKAMVKNCFNWSQESISNRFRWQKFRKRPPGSTWRRLRSTGSVHGGEDGKILHEDDGERRRRQWQRGLDTDWHGFGKHLRTVLVCTIFI